MSRYPEPIEILSDEDEDTQPVASGSRPTGTSGGIGGIKMSFGARSTWSSAAQPVYIKSDSDDDLPDIAQLVKASSMSALSAAPMPSATRVAIRPSAAAGAARKSALLDLLDDNSLLAAPPRRSSAAIASQDSIEAFTSDPIISPPKAAARKGKGRALDDVDKTNRIPVKKQRVTKCAAADASARKDEAAVEKARKMHEKQMEKARLKAEKEAEKSYAKKLADVNKLRVSKSEAVYEIHLYCSHDLSLPTSPIAGALPEIRRKLEEHKSAVHFLPERDSPVPGVIRFRRNVQAIWNMTLKQWDPIPHPEWQDESTIAVVVDAGTIVDKVQQGSAVLRDWVMQMKAAMGMRGKQQLFLVIRGLTKYYRKNSALANSEFRAMARAQLEGSAANRAEGRPHAGRVTKEEVEKQLVRLQVAEGCHMIDVETTEDVETWIWNLTADIAIRPYKLVTKSHLFFCPSESTKKSADPKKTLELMLGEVQGITESAAAGISDAHPTFRALMAAFERAERTGGPVSGEKLLENCEVRNLRNGTANGRRLNTALSKRVYHNMRGLDSLALS